MAGGVYVLGAMALFFRYNNFPSSGRRMLAANDFEGKSKKQK